MMVTKTGSNGLNHAADNIIGLPSLDEDGGISQGELNEAALNAFFQITSEWSLNTDKQRLLLGNPGRSRYFELKKNNHAKLSDDELDRLAYIIGIYTVLNVLYNEENCHQWLNNPSKPTSIWKGQSPMEYMLTGKLVALADVYRYLNGLRGAA